MNGHLDGWLSRRREAEHVRNNPQLAGEAFNFSNEIQVTVLELVNRILQLMNSDLVPHVRSEASNEIRHQYLSAAKARERLQWKPSFTLDDGLRRTIDWYRTFFSSQSDVKAYSPSRGAPRDLR